MNTDSTKIDFTIKVLLEDSKKIKNLEQENSDLKRSLAEACAKAQNFHDALIMEMQRGIRMEDKVREYERLLRDR